MAADGGNDIKGAKGGQSQRKPVEAPDSLNSIASANILDLLGEGELAGWWSDNALKDIFLDETPIMNADGTMNFTNVQVDWREGTQDQSYMTGFPSVENEIAIGVELKQAAAWTRAVNNIDLSAIRIRLSVSSLSKANTENGDINGYSVQYAIDLATDGGAFNEVLRTAFTGKTTTKYERMHRIDLPPATTGWVVRVRRLTMDTEVSSIQDTTAVESITEIIDMKLRYPNSALVGIKIDAAQFRNIPTRGYRKMGRLMRIPSNYNPVTRVYTGAWDGTFAIGWTNNPAWIFYDLVTNKRFGLGKYVDETQVDKWSLYNIAQYCDEFVADGKGGTEPRFTCTVFFQRQEEAYKVLQDLASVFRGISYWGSGAVIPVGDMPRDPVYTYTNANVKDGKFSYQGSTRRARHTVALVSWSDPEDFNRQKVEYVEDPEGIARYGIQITQITAVGCTSQGQAQRMGRWILLTERFETDTVTFSVGLDQTLVLPGTVIRVADAKRAGRRTGGRVANAATNAVTVDFMPVVAIGDELICIMPSGLAEKRPVTSIVGNTIGVTPAYSAAPLPESVWAVESPTVKTQLFSCISIGEGEGLTAVITALQHEPGKYAAVDTGTKIEPRPITAVMSAVQKPPTNLIVSAKDRAGYANANKVITCVWTAAEGAVGYDVQWRRDDGEWSAPQRVLGTEAELFNPFMGKYVCKVVALNGLGVYSVPAVTETYIVNDVSLTPGFVDELNADIANALLAANNAQATADGAIQTFWQDNAPVIGSGAGQAAVGDIWFDTNDGNRIWRVVGGVWVDAQDDQLAQAIASAATAQATADGKMKFFVGSVAPSSGYQLNDLWFDTTVKKVKRWNGTTWNEEIADVTLDQLGGSGVNLVPDQFSFFESSTVPTGMTGGNATLSMVAGGAISPYALKLIAGNAVSYAYFDYTNIQAPKFPRTAGKKYLVSAWVWSNAAINAGDAQMYIRGKPSDTAVNSALTPAVAANTWGRVGAIVDASTLADTNITAFVLFNNSTNGREYRVDGLMCEEMVGRLANASAYARGTAGGIALSALFAAQSAQATADGAVDIYRQSNAPTGMKIGDYWQDSDDGKWWYTANGTTWVEATDARLPQVVTDLQTTNGVVAVKTRLFFQESTPTASANGDMWYVPSTGITRYWNGTAWSLQADYSPRTQAFASLVKNGGFEMGLTDWTYDAGFYVEASTNAAMVGTYGLVKGPGAAATSYAARNTDPFPLSGGELVTAGSFINNVGGANGVAVVDVWFFKADGSWNGSSNCGSWDTSTSMSGTNWRQVYKTVKAPDNTALAYVVISTYNHTAGYWCFDQVRASKKDDRNIGSSRNLVANARFGRTTGGITPWAVGYNPAAATVTIFNYKGIWAGAANAWWNPSFRFADGGNVEMRFYNETGAAGSVTDIVCERVIPIDPAKRYEMSIKWAVYRCLASVMVYWLDSGGNYIGESGAMTTWRDTYHDTLGGTVFNAIQGYVLDGGFLSPPTNARGAKFVIRKQKTYTGSDSYLFVAQPYFGEAAPNQIDLSPWVDSGIDTADQISDGADTTTIYNGDTVYDGSIPWRRQGTSVKGSRKILGGARNSRASLVYGAAAVRTTTALSANSSGQISVLAHSVEISGETVTYNAVTNAIVGATPGTTYVVYTLDPYLDGGTRTYFAQTTILSAQQAGEGAVFIGNITVPTSGSSSGGGGGGGNPGDWCVDVDMILPDGRRAGDITAWDSIPCWNDNAEDPGIVHLSVESAHIEANQPSHMITTVSGASVIASDSTPMTLRDGSMVRLPEMQGKEALVRARDGTLHWEAVVKCVPMGTRSVAKIKVHQRCYFAGLVPGATIATHNPTYKP